MLLAGKGPSAADAKFHENTALGFEVDGQCVRHNEKIGSDSFLVLLVIVSGWSYSVSTNILHIEVLLTMTYCGLRCNWAADAEAYPG